MATFDFLDDPGTLAGVFRPLDEAETLPPACYTSEEFHQKEIQHIFKKCWNFFGSSSRIPNAGDYFTEDFLGIPLLFVRDNDGSVRAFSNSCRHRGAKVAVGEGNCRFFRCPYHYWTYGLDGHMRGTAAMKQAKDFRPEDNGLVALDVAEWGGFIFVKFTAGGPTLEEYLGDMPEQLAAYRCEELVLTKRVAFEVKCNWKNHIENSVEDYHVPMVHAATLYKLEGGYEHFAPETSGQWFVMRERHKGTRALLPQHVEHAFPRIADLFGHAAEGTNFVCLFPCTLIALTVDCAWYVQLSPRGPLATTVTLGGCFPRATVERPDFEEHAQYYYHRWVTAVAEDNGITELQLEGLRSPFARAGRISHLEPLIPRMGAWWVSRILEGEGRPVPRAAVPAAADGAATYGATAHEAAAE